jgi:hypothetical protein
MHVVSSTQLRPCSLRETFRMNRTPFFEKTVRRRDTICARLGEDGDLYLNEDAIADDFYSVLGLVSLGHHTCP